MRARDSEDSEGNPIGIPVDYDGNDIEDIVKFAITEGRQAQELMDDEQRKEFWYELQQGYCSECGRKLTPDRPVCHCTNDD